MGDRAGNLLAELQRCEGPLAATVNYCALRSALLSASFDVSGQVGWAQRPSWECQGSEEDAPCPVLVVAPCATVVLSLDRAWLRVPWLQAILRLWGLDGNLADSIIACGFLHLAKTDGSAWGAEVPRREVELESHTPRGSLFHSRSRGYRWSGEAQPQAAGPRCR